jgi:hypothetical protein
MRFDPVPKLWAVVGVASLVLLLGPVPLRAQQADAPEVAGPPAPAASADDASAQMRALAISLQGLQTQIERLSSQVSEMRAEQQRSRQESEELRRQVELLRSQLGPQVRMASYAVSQQQAPGPPLPYSQAPPAPAGPQTAQASGLPPAQSDENQQLTDAKLSDLYQTKVESSSKYRLRLSGLVLLNMFVNRGNVDNLDVPTLATEQGVLDSRGVFGGSLRQSQIGLQAFGPDVLGAHTSADVQFDFAGGFPQAPNGAEFGLVRLRTGTVRLDWANTSIVAGQDSLFFAPLTPTSLASLSVPALAYAGDLWTWTPQVRVEHRITMSDSTSFLVEGGILDSWSGDVPPEQFYRYETWGEESGQPAYATRLAWNQRLFGRTFTLGFGGYYGRQYWGAGRHVDGWAGTTDLTLPLGKLFTFTGEFYRGSATAGIGGGIGQDTLIAAGPFISSSTTIKGLHSLGGWSQLKFKPRPKFEFNGAFGQDNPIASQLRLFESNPGLYGSLLARNRSAFVNCIYQPRSDMLFSVEYRRIRTFQIEGDSYPANQVNLSVGYIF